MDNRDVLHLMQVNMNWSRSKSAAATSSASPVSWYKLTPDGRQETFAYFTVKNSCHNVRENTQVIQ